MIKQHHRQELEAPVEDQSLKEAEPVGDKLFDAKTHEPTVEDGHILETRSWATFTGATMQVVPAVLSLFRFCNAHDAWELAGKSWLSVLYTPGLIFETRGKAWASLGHCAYTAVQALELKERRVGKVRNFALACLANGEDVSVEWSPLEDP